jgi:hypothetical protein
MSARAGRRRYPAVVKSDDHTSASVGPVISWAVKTLPASDRTHELVVERQLDAISALVAVVIEPPRRDHDGRRQTAT